MKIVKPIARFGFIAALFGFLYSCVGSGIVEAPDTSFVPDKLPMNEVLLEDLSQFKAATGNWQTVGKVTSDFQVRYSFTTVEGSGILASQQTEKEKQDLLTNWEHGDLELEIEFMIPKQSNSGIYFQGRYEVQILDSWGAKEPHYGDNGGICQRWDESKPEGQKGYEGTAPKLNASKAPGLWQQFHVLFRAPRFDASGSKIQNARFEYVYHNGVLIHENVELTGPTRGSSFEEEGPMGPLRFQGDHGPVAFRNIRYKKFGRQTLELSNITYVTYFGNWDYIPGFDTLTVVGTGQVSSFDNLEELVGQPDHFGIKFKGDLEVPVDGEYLFTTAIDDGGDLSIDGSLIIHNQGDPGFGVERGLVFLTKGTHSLEQTYYEEVWLAGLAVYYEGPEIEKQPLASSDLLRRQADGHSDEPLALIPDQTPEMVRGFVNYGFQKRTHTISVGDPAGVHYSYDLSEGALLKFWKGEFADVSNMWRGRGESQLLIPLSNAVELTAGVSIAMLSDPNGPWPKESIGYKSKGYRVDEQGRPVFLSQLGELMIQDGLMPSPDSIKLVRKLQVKSSSSQHNYWCRIASADKIEKFDNGWYSIGGQYYLEMNGNQTGEKIRSVHGGMELVVPILAKTNATEIEYSTLW